MEEDRTIPGAPTRTPHAGAETRSADFELVRSVVRRDRDAIDRFVERMRCIPRILHAKNHRYGQSLDGQDIDDLSQEVFSTIWSKLDSYKGDASLETWVYSFCVYALMNALRREKRKPLELLDAPYDASEGAPTTAVEEAQLYAAIEELGKDEERVVVLKHFDGQTFDAIGKRLSISSNTAKTRYYRAISRLRSLLRTSWKGQR